jgi:hypothetical protein
MAFDKVIPSKIAEYKIYNVASTDELIKEASDVDFPEGFIYDPDFLYMWVRIVSAGEFYGPNKNGDYFPENELISYWETFREAHPFKNHENKNVENAIGKIIDVRWNPVMKCVEILKGIDKKRAPEVARGFQKGYLTDVSMGCKVPFTVCSICGNKARKRSEFCEHVRYHRLQFLGNGERVYEINYKPRFHDSSTVLNGAERVAKAFYIVDKAPQNGTISFNKVASTTGATLHYIPVAEAEMKKIASVKENIHPLLKEPVMEKSASASPMMKKIAELEKELTGKLLNYVSSTQKGSPKARQLLEVIKFLSEKRLDEKSLKKIALSIKEVANQNGVPASKAFSTLVGVAELMGIEFYPSEIHTLLSQLTDAGLNRDLDLSDRRDKSLEVYPSDYARTVQKAVVEVDPARSFSSPSSLFKVYDDAAHNVGGFMADPFSFLSSYSDDDDMNSHPPVHVIRVIKRTLSPMLSLRSHHPEHLYPRLSVFLSGHRPIVGDSDVHRDLNILGHPSSAGDVLGRLAYALYQRMRPEMMGTRLIKLAAEEMDGFDKQAAPRKPTPHIGYVNNKPKIGLGYRQLAMGAIPLAYGASAFQKSRRDNGGYLSDTQNFVADHPGMITIGALLAGKPLSKGVVKAAKGTASAIGKGINAIKAPFTKMADDRYAEEMDKEASGDFNIFQNNEVLKRYMKETGANPEQASAIKVATLLTMGGMDKIAFEIMDHYDIPNQEKDRLVKIASEYMDEEMDKAAEDFTNNLILSAFGDTSPLAPTLPGRALDALIFKQIGKMVGPKEPKTTVPSQPTKGEVSHD